LIARFPIASPNEFFPPGTVGRHEAARRPA